MDYAEQVIEKRLSPELLRLEWLYRLHYATDGVVGNVMNLMRFASVLCDLHGGDQIDQAMLSLAFQQRLAKHLRGKVDPFAEPATDRFIPPALSAEPAQAPARRSRQKHSPSLGSRLTTG